MVGLTRGLALLLAGGCLAAALAGCGGSSSKKSTSQPSGTATQSTTGGGAAFSKAKLETKLQGVLSSSGSVPGGQQTGPTISSVTCPSTQPTQGGTVTCQLSGAASLSGSVIVTFSNSQGTSFSYKGSYHDASGASSTVSGNSTLG